MIKKSFLGILLCVPFGAHAMDDIDRTPIVHGPVITPGIQLFFDYTPEQLIPEMSEEADADSDDEADITQVVQDALSGVAVVDFRRQIGVMHAMGRRRNHELFDALFASYQESFNRCQEKCFAVIKRALQLYPHQKNDPVFLRALWQASYYGYKEQALFLIERDIDFVEQDYGARSPLHEAVIRGDCGIIKILLLAALRQNKIGRLFAKRDESGKTAREIAEQDTSTGQERREVLKDIIGDFDYYSQEHARRESFKAASAAEKLAYLRNRQISGSAKWRGKPG